MKTALAAGEPPRRLLGRLANVARTLLPEPAPSAPVPPTGPVYQWYHRKPLDVRLELAPWCPHCDHVLALTDGRWRCNRASCLADWNIRGTEGRWLTNRPRTSDASSISGEGRS